MASTHTVRIGSASGFWGDTASAAPQLVQHGQIQYLVFDYLAEVTMSILAAQKAKDPALGYATDFVRITMRQLLPQLKAQGIRVVANAGGVNPLACRDALAAVAAELGLPLKIGVVLGDDLSHRADEFRAAGVTEMFSGAAFPARTASMNAYLGARPVAEALKAGAEVVITGRCVDSAVTLGVLMHEFGWRDDEFDKLAQGSLAGHLVECGAQCTGGLFTDWEQVPGWDEIGFPIIEASADGSFVITKPPGTGGLVTPATVMEQMLYEIGDPRAYHMPDVACDFTQVRFEQAGEHRVRVSGAKGRVPTPTCKVSATFMDGYRNQAILVIAGEQAAAKAERTAQALLTRIKRMLAQQGLPGFTEELVEVVGGETMYGASGQATAREVVLKMAVKSPSRQALELFGREFAPAATSMSPGTTGFGTGRPDASPVIRLFSFLVPKAGLKVQVQVDEAALEVPFATGAPFDAAQLPPALCHPVAAMDTGRMARRVKLIQVAHGRSGDKGDKANIGIIARRPEWLPWLATWLTPERVAAHFAHNFAHQHPGRCERFDLPGTHSMNFLLHNVLGGGGMASLRTDNLAKCYAQVLLGMELPIPDEWTL